MNCASQVYKGEIRSRNKSVHVHDLQSNLLDLQIFNFYTKPGILHIGINQMTSSIQINNPGTFFKHLVRFWKHRQLQDHSNLGWIDDCQYSFCSDKFKEKQIIFKGTINTPSQALMQQRITIPSLSF